MLAVGLNIQLGSQDLARLSHQQASTSYRCRSLARLQIAHLPHRQQRCCCQRRAVVTQAIADKTKDKAKAAEEEQLDPASTTEKYGLEAGLFKVFTSKDSSGKSKGDQAKELLKKYGSAYLITSISFAIVSFAVCYALVSSGVNVAALLEKVGLKVSDTSERVGTFALAYAAHKALSPVRFPPTVALTPVVASWLGKKPAEQADNDKSS